MRPTDLADSLLERDGDVGRLDAAIESAVDGRGSVVLVEGPAGIGKSALLDAARRTALDRGVGVLAARGGELERDFVYGIVHQLFDAVARSDGGDLFEGAAALAAPLFGASERRSDSGDPEFSTLNGLYWLTSDLAERTPLLLIVDDAHWADDASLRFVRYLSRRVEDLPLVLLLGARSDEPGGQLNALLEPTVEADAAVLHPAALTPAASSRLITTHLGAADDAFVAACQRATGGNPFLLRELLRSLAAEGVAPIDRQAARVERIVPESIRRAVLLRLMRLPEDAQALAKAVAVLEGEAQPALAASIAGLDRDRAAAAVDDLTSTDVLTAGRPLTFIHPVVREAVRAATPPGERGIAHARAARLLFEEAAPGDQVAAHLLAADPAGHTWAIKVLRDAASEALARGAAQLAVSYLRRARGESPASGHSPDLLLDLGHAEAAAGDRRAPQTLSEARDLATDQGLRARITLDLARTISVAGDFKAQSALLREAVATLEAIDPDLALRAEAEMIGVARLDPATRPWAEERLAHLRDRATAASPSTVVLLANLALSALENGEPAAAVAHLAREALQGGWLWGQHFAQGYAYAANALTWTDHFTEARRAWDDALLDVGGLGTPSAAGLAYAMRSHLRMRTGDVLGAEADVRISADISRAFDSYDWAAALPYLAAFEADALLERDVAAAGRLVNHTGEWEEQVAFFLDSRARWRLADGDPAGAAEDFLAAGRALGVRGGRDSPGVVPWRSGAAIALTRLGERGEASGLAEEELALARAVGAPRALGIALRACGLAAHDRSTGLRSLEESVVVLGGSGAQLDHARALVDLGSSLRRLRRSVDARGPLRAALDLAHRCGSTLLADQARQELLATGARPRRPVITGIDALTPSERRVAELVAGGMSNRQVAQSLFVSMRTVAVHLSHAYQKLGIAGRDQLEDVLGGPQVS